MNPNEQPVEAWITNDAVVLGIIFLILAVVFKTSSSDNPKLRRFYTFVPSILLCYFLPSLLNTFGIVDPQQSQLYYVSSRYLLPASLVLLTLSIDFQQIMKLGFKAVVMFLTGTAGIMIGAPLSLLIMSTFAPEMLGVEGPDDIWRGMTTVAGSWIGGGANQTAMREVFEVGDKIWTPMVTMDIIIGNVWMGFLLYGAGIANRIDRRLKADSSAIQEVKEKIESYRASISKIPTMADVAAVLGVAFGITALGHFVADNLAPWIGTTFPGASQLSLDSKFFWLVITATTCGLALSFTRVRELEGVGASRYGSLLLYILVASIGLSMNVAEIFSQPKLFLLGAIWISVHAGLLILVAILIKAPFFFLAVGSQANVGGAASAPIVASAFHPALAPVGVLLAVLGYAVGTYAAWATGLILMAVAQ